MLDVERVENNTGQLCSIRNDTKHCFGVSLGVFLVLIGVYSSWLGETERKWNGLVTVTAVILAPISLAKATPCSTALAARSDPSVGIKIFLNIEFSSRLCFFLMTGSVASVLDPQEP